MKIETKTKFKIGDKIHVICFNRKFNKWHILNKVLITKIIIKIVINIENIKTKIIYKTDILNEKAVLEIRNEGCCFATKAEAQAECNRRNNGK